MKTAAVILCLLLSLAVVWLYVQAYSSRAGGAAGLSEGRLTDCPDKPNCVCSEYPDKNATFVEAIEVRGINGEAVMGLVQQIITEQGGVVTLRQGYYLAATFKSQVFGFVDDLEVRFDETSKRLHVRSASRVGHSDFGVNRQRLEQLRRAFQETSSDVESSG